jgi:hypothetical protein
MCGADAFGIFPRRYINIVVPAKAGTHTPQQKL